MRVAAGLLMLLAVVYSGDYLSVQYRIPHHREPLGSVVVNPYLAIAQKNNRVEFVPEDPQTVTCVNALFPRFGYQPCWWVRRHTDQRIDE